VDFYDFYGFLLISCDFQRFPTISAISARIIEQTTEKENITTLTGFFFLSNTMKAIIFLLLSIVSISVAHSLFSRSLLSPLRHTKQKRDKGDTLSCPTHLCANDNQACGEFNDINGKPIMQIGLFLPLFKNLFLNFFIYFYIFLYIYIYFVLIGF
jgi:hypothetical protein